MGPAEKQVEKTGAKVAVLPSRSYSPAQAAEELLSDSSVTVRRAAAEYLALNRNPLQGSLPKILRQVFLDSDPQVVSSLVSALERTPDSSGVVIPALLRLFRDSRYEIACDAALALGEGKKGAATAAIPLMVLAQSAFNREERDLCDRARGCYEGAPFASQMSSMVDYHLSMSERSQKQVLKNMLASGASPLEDGDLRHLLVGVCSPGVVVRSFALRALAAYGDSLRDEQRPFVWAALAYVMADYEAASSPNQHEFLNVVRASEMPAALAAMVERFDCRDNVDVRMARDFTAIHLARHADPLDAIERLTEMLWAQNASTVSGAASNLTILLLDIDKKLGVGIVNRLMEAVAERAFDGKEIVDALVSAFVRLDTFHAEILNQCAELVSLHQSPEVMIAVAKVIGSSPPTDPALTKQALELLEYLSSTPYPRVALTARRILSRA